MRFEVFQHGQLLQEVNLQDSELWVGRDDSCKIRLDDRSVSRKHALIRKSQLGEMEFEKVSPFGWIKLNGQETVQSKLKPGDRLEMGSFEIRIGEDAPSPVSIPEEVESAIEEGFVQEAPAPQVEAESMLQEDSGNEKTSKITTSLKVKPVLNFGSGNQYEILDEEVAIGRSQQCHVVLEDRRSSRKHSLIKRKDGNYYLQDLGSANGTLLNGHRIEEQELQSGDEIQIGDTKFTFEMVQSDFEIKKQAFMTVPQPEIPMVPSELMGSDFQNFRNQNTVHSSPNLGAGFNPEPVAPSFEELPAQRKSIIGKMLDRYRAMNTRQQIIYGILVLAVLWMLLDEEPEETKVKLNTGAPKKEAVKSKEDKKNEKGTPGITFEMLTPEQKRYVEAQYQIAFESYKSREYDSCLLELSKIFSLVQDYKNAREIEAFAKEGKRKLEALEEERKRKEQERQTQLRIESLIDQIGHLMSDKKFKEAEALFPEVELLQPENQTIAEWRKQLAGELEKIEKEKEQKRILDELHRQSWADFKKATELEGEKKFYEALDRFDEILSRKIEDQKLIQALKDETVKVESMIEKEKEPFLTQGKNQEKEGKLSEAYRSYQSALQVDPMDEEAPKGMKRIKGILTDRAKHLYTEGVFAESYGDLDTADKKFREVLEVVPKEDPYYQKAESKLFKLHIFKKNENEEIPQ